MKQFSLTEIKKQAIPILTKANVKKAALFGSYARGDNTKDSDIDILVDLPRGKTLLDVVDLKNNLERVLKRSVDVVEYEGLDPLFRDSILNSQYSLL